MLSALQRIQLNSHAAAKKYATLKLPHTPSPQPVFGELRLPPPPPLISQLVTFGLNESAATRISTALTSVTHQLRDSCYVDSKRRCEQLHAEGLHQDFPSLTSTYVVIYTKTVKDWTAYVLNDVAPRVKKALSLRRPQGRLQHKPAFNAVRHLLLKKDPLLMRLSPLLQYWSVSLKRTLSPLVWRNSSFPPFAP